MDIRETGICQNQSSIFFRMEAPQKKISFLGSIFTLYISKLPFWGMGKGKKDIKAVLIFHLANKESFIMSFKAQHFNYIADLKP